jgi:hypothetical protein
MITNERKNAEISAEGSKLKATVLKGRSIIYMSKKFWLRCLAQDLEDHGKQFYQFSCKRMIMYRSAKPKAA